MTVPLALRRGMGYSCLMTNHTKCSHEATKSARAKCRKDRAKFNAEIAEAIKTGPKVDLAAERAREIAATLPADPFTLFPQAEDDWADPDQWYGTGDDSGPGDADLLD